MTSRPGALRRRVRAAFGGAERRGCRERGCALGLGGIPNCTVLKGEEIAEGRRVCDCVIIHAATPPRLVLVELKSGGAKPGQVFEKFSNAVDLVSRMERDIFAGEKYDASILLLVGRRRRRSLYATCRAREFVVGGKRCSVQVLPCGTHLDDVYKMLAGAGRGSGGQSGRAV